MSVLSTVKIKAEPSCTKVFIDDEEVKNVQYFKAEQRVGERLPTLTLEIVAREILYDYEDDAELME